MFKVCTLTNEVKEMFKIENRKDYMCKFFKMNCLKTRGSVGVLCITALKREQIAILVLKVWTQIILESLKLKLFKLQNQGAD